MSFINKKKFVKLAISIEEQGYDGKKVLELLEVEGYDEFLFNSSEIKVEKEGEELLIIADFVYLVIQENQGIYKLTIE